MATPSFHSRLKVAARAVTGLFSDNSLNQAYGLLSGIYPTATGAIPQRGTKEILEAYNSMPWLRAVTQKISNAVANTEWSLHIPSNGKRNPTVQRAIALDRSQMIAKAVDNGEMRTITDHIFLDALASANSYLVGPSLFRTTQVHVDLVGESFWIKERNGVGAPVAFWPIPPHWVISTPTPSHRFYNVQFSGWSGEIPDTEMVWFCDPDPSNPYGRGSGIARALSDELETDEYAARHTRMTFINRARPDLIIWPEESKNDAGVITGENAERLAERWRSQHQGFWRAALPYFATRKLGVKEIGQSFQDLSLVDLREFERDTIRQVFGVPPEMMGIVTPGTARATIETGEYIFEKHVIGPRREFLRTYLQERVIPEYDERLILGYASTIGEDRTYILDTAKAAPWTRTTNEWRKMQYLEPLPDGKGDSYMMPLNSTPVADPSVAPPVPASVLASPSGVEPTKRAAGIEAVIKAFGVTHDQDDTAHWRDAAACCKEEGDHETAHLLEDAVELSVDDLPALSRRMGIKEIAVRRLIAGQLADLRERTPLHSLVAAAERRDSAALLAYVPIDVWADGLGESTRQWLRDAFMAGVAHGAEETGVRLVERDAELPLNVPNALAIEWARAAAGALIKKILEATLKAIRDIISEAISLGWNARRTARLIRDTIGLTDQQTAAVARFAARLAAQGVAEDKLLARVERYAEAQRRARALTIARTELITAGNAGQQALWDLALKNGALRADRMRKKWIVTPDERLEAVCEALGEEDPIPVDAAFSNGMLHPPAHPNCRCTTGLVMAQGARSSGVAVTRAISLHGELDAAVKAGMRPLAEAIKAVVR